MKIEYEKCNRCNLIANENQRWIAYKFINDDNEPTVLCINCYKLFEKLRKNTYEKMLKEFCEKQ
jgi:hypothetical protein